MGASSLIVLMISAVAFSGIAILISKVVLKATKNKAKGEPYECGVPTTGPSWIQFNVGYYLFALIFLIFDDTRELLLLNSLVLVWSNNSPFITPLFVFNDIILET